MLFSLAVGADGQVSGIGMLHGMRVPSVHSCQETDDLLEELQTTIDRDDQRLVCAGRSDDFEERFLGGDALRLLEQSQCDGIYILDDIFSTFGFSVFEKIQILKYFDYFVSQGVVYLYGSVNHYSATIAAAL